jgi:NADP-dependent 3-hydroxy acid dehydrogenase YdfG
LYTKSIIMESLKGKKVLIVGATGGIGSKVSKLLSSSGAIVFLTGRNAQKLLTVAADCNISNTSTFEMDIANEQSVNSAIQQVIAAATTIDIVINAAGIGIIKTMDTLSTADFMQTLQTNLIGTFYVVKAVLPNLKEQKRGLIINIPGVLGKVPMAGAAAYSASKYGIVGMMQSIREELKRTDIRITNLFLGGVDSPFWDTIDLRVQRDKMVVTDEAAKAIWFLCQQPVSGVVSEMVLQPFNHQAI